MRELDDTAEEIKIQDSLIYEHIRSMVNDLTCRDVISCQKARRDLVAIGKSAVPALIGVLVHPDARVRWEAAKALGQIGDPTAIPALILALEDKEFDVRWLAAEALASMGTKALPDTLRAVVAHADSTWLRENGYHVIAAMVGQGKDAIIMPVLNALRGDQPAVEAPVAAAAALKKLSA